MDKNYIDLLKEEIESLEIRLFELREELKEKQGYQTLEDLDTSY